MERTEWDNEKEPAVERFLTKLNWKIHTGEMRDITMFQIDVYKFVFYDAACRGKSWTIFVAYIKGLDLSKVKSTMKIFVWLYQHGIYFRLKFGWNRNLPINYNLRNLFMPMKIRHTLFGYGHDELMACRLEKKEGD